MLVLSRKLNEEIVIAGNIRVKVLGITGNRVHLGIEAPPHVPILREEIQSRKPAPSINESQNSMSAVCD